MLNEFENDVGKTLAHFKVELGKFQLGRASVNLVEDIQVEAYSSFQPIKGLANVSVKDAHTLFIQPWDKAIIKDIEKAIQTSNIGINPQNDGYNIILRVPPTTEERRKELVKKVSIMTEEAKIQIRNMRVHAKKRLEKQKEDNVISEDELKSWEKKLQDKVDFLNIEIDKLAKDKEKQIMEV